MNDALKEQRKRGSPLYPLQVYRMGGTQKPIFVSYHWHREIEILFVLAGDLKLTIDGRKLSGTAGDIFIIGREELHGMYTSDPDTRYTAIVFPLEFLNFEMFDYCQCNILNPLCKKELIPPVRIDSRYACYKDIWHELIKIDEINAEKPPGYQLATKASLLSIVSLIIRDGLLEVRGKKARAKTDMNTVKSIISYINEHYAEPIRLKNIAESFFFSPKYFSRYFKNAFNKTFVIYLMYIRIEHATELLINTDMQVMHIATAVGFNNFSYFIKKFKETTGLTPLQFRNQKSGR